MIKIGLPSLCWWPETRALAIERFPELLARGESLFSDFASLYVQHAEKVLFGDVAAQQILRHPEAPRLVYFWLSRAAAGLESTVDARPQIESPND